MRRCIILTRHDDISNKFYCRIEWPAQTRDEDKINVMLTRNYKRRESAIVAARKACKRLDLDWT